MFNLINILIILILALSNTTINISAITTFKQIMVDFSINFLHKVFDFHQANFRCDF